MLLLIDKPSGITSYDVIRRLKKAFPKQKIGHGGTLDPLASGLLIIWIDKDTKRLWAVQSGGKRYETTIDLSQTSDTRDVDFWEAHEQFPLAEQWGKKGLLKWWIFVQEPSREALENLLQSLIPEYELPIPAFSAIKQKGQKLYDLAREGNIQNPLRVMKFFHVELLEYNFPLVTLRVHVGGGTYIRSLAFWLGQQLGTGGILTMLRRTQIGERNLEGELDVIPGTDVKGKVL